MVHGELARAGATWTEWLGWLLRRRRHHVVRGDSMRPTLAPGDHILMNPSAYRHQPPSVGDIVVAQHPFERARLLVKRVTSIDANGRCFITGDNPDESTDSHALGALPLNLILGRVTRRLP